MKIYTLKVQQGSLKQKAFNFINPRFYFKVVFVSLKLKVDEKEIPLNDFVSKILEGTIIGAVTSLKGIKDDWKKIQIEIKK